MPGWVRGPMEHAVHVNARVQSARMNVVHHPFAKAVNRGSAPLPPLPRWGRRRMGRTVGRWAHQRRRHPLPRQSPCGTLRSTRIRVANHSPAYSGANREAAGTTASMKYASSRPILSKSSRRPGHSGARGCSRVRVGGRYNYIHIATIYWLPRRARRTAGSAISGARGTSSIW